MNEKQAFSSESSNVIFSAIFVTKVQRAPMLHDTGGNSLHNVLAIVRNKSIG